MQAYLQFVLQHRAMLLFGFLCVFWGNFGQSFFLGWYGDAIQKDLGLSAQSYGAAYSLATLASALTVMWLGAWIDRWPLRRYTLFVSLGLLITCVTLSQVHHLWLLCVGFYGVRLFGQGLMPHTGITTMARSFEQNRGKAISLATTGVPVGEVVLPLLAVWLIQSVGWQGSWWVIAATIPLLFMPLAFYLLRHEPAAEPKDAAHAVSGRGFLYRDYRFWLALPTLLATPFVLTAVFIHQGFILQVKGWSPAAMAAAFVVYGVVHWLASMVCGVLVDRFSGVRLLKLYLLPLVAALLVSANAAGVWALFAMMVLLAFTIGAAGTVVSSMWAEVYGAAVLGRVRSAVSGLTVFSTAVSPWLMGVGIDHGVSLAWMFNSMAAVILLGLVLLRWSYRCE